MAIIERKAQIFTKIQQKIIFKENRACKLINLNMLMDIPECKINAVKILIKNQINYKI